MALYMDSLVGWSSLTSFEGWEIWELGKLNGERSSCKKSKILKSRRMVALEFGQE